MNLNQIILLILTSYATFSFAQDSTQTNPALTNSGIRITASVSTKEVPLNRILKFTIQVEWFGDLERFEINEVENPIVRNFKIKSNSSSDRRELDQGKLKAIKTFEFDLIPEELGMGYIEGVLVKYIDKETGEGKHLMTNRLEAKVIEPLPEPGSRLWIVKWIIICLFFLALIICGILWQLHRSEIKRQRAALIPPKPVEEDYLQELKNSVSLKLSDSDMKDAFSTVSLILRKYLAAKYKFAATHDLVDEIINTLKQNEVQERLIIHIQEVLNICDVVKFSGSEGKKSDLERVYTLTEEVLNENLKNAIQAKEV